jgi:uncharacterized damage-inducible protein DinB
MTRDLLRTLFEAELDRTRPFLDAVPPDELAWAPAPRSYTLGRLAMHVATLPGWMPAYTTRDGHDMGAGGPGPATPSDVSAITDAFVAASARGRAALDACDDATLAQPWTLWRNGVVLARMTRAEAIATFALQHLAHHRGQLGVYLRLCGRPVPALYGDSADAQLGPAPSAR